MRATLDRWFSLETNGTTPRTEVVAGLTTYLALAYIVFVQPAVLSAAGMDFGAVMVATCLASAFATLLMAWWANFDKAWPGLEERYGKRFYRMWKYYLMSCAGFFRSRQGQLWQLVLSKTAREWVYRSVR